MKHLIRLTDFTKEEVFEIFKIADEISRGEYQNTPCEVLSDLYALSRRRVNFLNDKFLFVGENGNIGLAGRNLHKSWALILNNAVMKSIKWLA